MKYVVLPYFASSILRALCVIISLVLDLIYLILTPIKWLKTKAYIVITIGALAGGIYLYFSGAEDPIQKTVICFAVVILSSLLLKLFRKWLGYIRPKLMRIVNSPLGLCEIRLPGNPFKLMKQRAQERKARKEYIQLVEKRIEENNALQIYKK